MSGLLGSYLVVQPGSGTTTEAHAPALKAEGGRWRKKIDPLTGLGANSCGCGGGSVALGSPMAQISSGPGRALHDGVLSPAVPQVPFMRHPNEVAFSDGVLGALGAMRSGAGRSYRDGVFGTRGARDVPMRSGAGRSYDDGVLGRVGSRRRRQRRRAMQRKARAWWGLMGLGSLPPLPMRGPGRAYADGVVGADGRPIQAGEGRTYRDGIFSAFSGLGALNERAYRGGVFDTWGNERAADDGVLGALEELGGGTVVLLGLLGVGIGYAGWKASK